MNIADDCHLTIVMLSQLGTGEGGRETWMMNFLREIARQHRPVRFDVVHRSPDSASTLLELAEISTLVENSVAIKCDEGSLPITIKFLAKLVVRKLRNKLPVRGPILAVGGLGEALAAIVIHPNLRGNCRRIIWLRSIYTKEKAGQIPSFLQRIVLAAETTLLRHFFGLVLTNGDDTASFYRDHGVKSFVIKNAVPLSTWGMPVPQVLGRVKIAFIGRLAEVKGIRSFLDAVELARSTGELDRFEFVVAGDGPFRDRVKSLDQRGLLSYRGLLDNASVVDLVRSVHCCVALTLLSEGLGGGGVSNALIEQMAASRIIVAWDNLIFRSVVGPDCAYLVDQGNSAALLSTFVGIDKDRSTAASKAAVAHTVSLRYSMEGHVHRFFEILNRKAGSDIYGTREA